MTSGLPIRDFNCISDTILPKRRTSLLRSSDQNRDHCSGERCSLTIFFRCSSVRSVSSSLPRTGLVMSQVVISIWTYLHSSSHTVPGFVCAQFFAVARSVLTVLTVTNTCQHSWMKASSWLRCAGIDPAVLTSNVGLEMIKHFRHVLYGTCGQSTALVPRSREATAPSRFC